MSGAGAGRTDRAARRKAEFVARGCLHALQPGRGPPRDADRERLQGHPLHDREIRRAWVTLRRARSRSGLSISQPRALEYSIPRPSRAMTAVGLARSYLINRDRFNFQTA